MIESFITKVNNYSPDCEFKLNMRYYKFISDIIPTVATTGDGLQEGLQWIAEMLNIRHLPKDSDQLLQMEQPSAKTEHKSFLSYFGKPWQLFYSLFIGSEDL